MFSRKPFLLIRRNSRQAPAQFFFRATGFRTDIQQYGPLARYWWYNFHVENNAHTRAGVFRYGELHRD